MAEIGRKVTLIVKGKVNQSFAPEKLKAGARVAAQEYQRQVIQRTVDGYSNKGTKFASLKPRTIIRKARFLSRRRPSGKYAAAAPTDILRRSGNMLRRYKVYNWRARAESTGNIVVDWDEGFDSASVAAQSEGLETGRLGNASGQPRPWRGLSPVSTARGKAERKAITNAFLDYIGTTTRNIGTIIEKK
jgi:hypothetical protein